MNNKKIRDQLAVEKEFWQVLGSLMRSRILLIKKYGNTGIGTRIGKMADNIEYLNDYFKANRKYFYQLKPGTFKNIGYEKL